MAFLNCSAKPCHEQFMPYYNCSWVIVKIVDLLGYVYRNLIEGKEEVSEIIDPFDNHFKISK